MKARWSRSMRLLLIVVLGALFVSACGGSEDEGTATAGGGASTTAAQELLDDPRLPPAPENADGADVAGAQRLLLEALATPEFEPAGEAFDIGSADRPVWLIQAAPSIAVTIPVAKAFHEAARAAGVEVHECPGRSTPEGNAICIDQAIEAGAGSIVAFSVDPASIKTYLQKARRAGIKVVAGNNAMRMGEPTDPNTDASVSHDYYGAGYLNGVYAVAALGADVNALCLTIPDFKVTLAVCRGFADAVKELAPDATVKEQGATVAKLVEQTTAATNSAVLNDSNLNFIMTSIDDLVPIVVAQLRRLNKKPGDILVGGQNGTADALQRIAGGDYQVVTAGQNVNWWGWAFFDAGARVQADAIGGDTVVTAPNALFTAESFESDGPFEYAAADELYGFGDGDVYKSGYQELWRP